jgi:SAM-dependent methyltransferase
MFIYDRETDKVEASGGSFKMPDSDMVAAKRTDVDVLLDTLNFQGKRVVDVGCGVGDLTKRIGALGADALGIDPNAKHIAAALAQNQENLGVFQVAVAESLPLPANSTDVVIFFNSLHHVEPANMDVALDEAARVLKPGGELYLSEPMAAGSNFETMKIFSDESVVRNAAYDAMKRSIATGKFEQIEEKVNVRPRVVENFETFCQGIVESNPKRAALVNEKKEELRSLFEMHGRKIEDGYEFVRLTRINYLRKI